MEDPLAWFRQYAARFELEDEANNSGVPFAYFAGVGGAPLSVEPLAYGVAGIIATYNHLGPAIDVVAHSFGVEVILWALRTLPGLHVRQLTLIAGATNEDCKVNGLNVIARFPQVQKVLILYSPNDVVLAGPGTLPGYGQLGLHGPQNISPALHEIMEPLANTVYTGDHSDYFNRTNNERTYALTTATHRGATP